MCNLFALIIDNLLTLIIDNLLTLVIDNLFALVIDNLLTLVIDNSFALKLESAKRVFLMIDLKSKSFYPMLGDYFSLYGELMLVVVGGGWNNEFYTLYGVLYFL
jgi:hypothetical protein